MDPEPYKNFINGEWVEGRSGDVLEDRNPADTRELIGIFQRSGARDVEDAVAAAECAYRSWRLTPAPRRAEILFRAARMLQDRKEELARDMTREMGKVLLESRGDVQEAIDMAYYMAGEGRRLYGQTTPSELPNKFAMSVRMPVGVCGLITPWNFPMAIPSWKILPALVCGNTVVIKPAEDTPLSCYHFVKIVSEAGLPRGVLNLVAGTGPDAGEPLVTHPAVRLVSFTGSTEVGRRVAELCAPVFKHSNLEMGGKNVLMVMEDADLELAVDGAVWGGFGTTGQRCTAASRVIVQKKLYKEFVEMLVERAEALKVGNGLDPNVQVGPLINRDQLNRVQQYVQIGINEGARLMCGGHAIDHGQYACGFFHEATVFSEVSPKMRIAREEIFGPVVSVIPCDDLESAIEIGNGVRYGLSAAIYTRDVNKAFTAMRDMYTGIFYVNASTIGAEIHLPFGGTKDTGNGHREAGTAALDVFSEWKSIYVDYSGRLQRAQIDTFSP
ncbi:MAG: aldehyde dehydrogenase family protein [Acidobacteria bacterium]|nr:aldehyde dehydrogenase family protein [Acidobacteriota bacterium]